MDIQEILDMWEKDGVIDQFKLDDTTIKNATLHSKYLSLITVAKLKKKTIQQSYDNLLKDKWLYYNGKMSQSEMDIRKWDYDPFNGLNKPLKSDLNHWYNSDKDIQKSQAELEYYKVIIETLKEILDAIKWRHSQIKNIIEWRKFEAGV
jgi:hypothetical protein